MCELDGLLAGVMEVMELGLHRNVGRTQLYEVPGWLLNVLVISWEACRDGVTAP